MADCNVGDRVLVESERVGQPAREGEVLEVLGAGAVIHYRVRWEGGHETTLFPSAGSLKVIHRAAKAGSG
ncbi:MAG: DUF1918 domain-containing protein [Chloroflexi bacterium]|nr:MAG: DUF1918 domain-containing protein [Chloroflexota bacterium]TME17289.1 MAG: DUF1918 domain-containing protein [Chloroflexota bacterium]TME19212.1 MAG: DUF1918 domain-containing protein [Chloroflexota bacterium]